MLRDHNKCPFCNKEFDKGLHKRSKDHIPPKNIYSGNYPPNLHTIKVCRSCNNGSSVEDEIFGVVIKLSFARGTDDRLVNSVANTLAQQHKILRDILSSSTRYGQFVRVSLKPEYREKVEKVILKIAKFLFWETYNEVCLLDASHYGVYGLNIFENKYLKKEILENTSELKSIFSTPTSKGLNRGTFKYHIHKDVVGRVYFKLVFFDKVDIWVIRQI